MLKLATMDYPRRRAEALDKLAAGDPQAAFGLFRGCLSYPEQLERERWVDAFGVLAQIVEAIAGEPLAGQITAIAREPDDVQALYDAGYALHEQGLFELAACVLDRANRVAPGTASVVMELSSALEESLRFHDAARVLHESTLVGREPWPTYLYAYNALMSGSLAQARAILATVGFADGDELGVAVRRLEGMFARADAIAQVSPLDHEDLDGWHAVLHGSVLLHESVEGFSEAMRGRYAYVSDGFGLLRAGLEAALAVLEASEIAIPRILAAPDRSSQILAWAAAQRTGAPLEQLLDAPDAPGLIVVYDLDRVGDVAPLQIMQAHRPGQVLWAHASCWTNPFPYTPDLTTFLYQTCVSPWEGGALRVDPETQKVVAAEPDDSPIERIGANILAAEPVDSHSSRAQLLALVHALRRVEGEGMAGMRRRVGQRTRQHKGSPVPSNRFS
jgi:hypothetical protein